MSISVSKNTEVVLSTGKGLSLYQWPVDIERYDREPQLREGEETASANVVSRWKRGIFQRDKTRAELQRLLIPIHDAMSIHGSGMGGWRPHSVYPFMVRMMLERRSTFWAWSPQEWAEVVATAKPGRGTIRYSVAAIAVLLCNVDVLDLVGIRLIRRLLARRIFPPHLVDEAAKLIAETLSKWGYKRGETSTECLELALYPALLRNHSPYIGDLSVSVLEGIRQDPRAPHAIVSSQYRLSLALHRLGILSAPLRRHINPQREEEIADVSIQWLEVAQKWEKTSTLCKQARGNHFLDILKTGRWLSTTHPDITRPGQWTIDLLAEFIAVVDRSRVGDWTAGKLLGNNLKYSGSSLSPRAKVAWLGAMRRFFTDLERWKWTRFDFNPRLDMPSPKGWVSLISHKPRDIKSSIWIKLVWASLNLTAEDLSNGSPNKHTYPLEFVQAAAVVWTHCGLRSNEIARLHVGCIRYIEEGTFDDDGNDLSEHVCYLDVPVNKTNAAYTKPVGLAVGRAIKKWEAVRPEQPDAIDEKDSEHVHYLFAYRSKRMATDYINESLIPILCKKAGVPREDAPGKTITSHRGRASSATMYYNTKEGMTLFELQEWLGHKHPGSTRHYVAVTPLKQAQSFARAHKNSHYVDVLLDVDAIKSGVPSRGGLWRFVPLGNGDYCGNPEWVTCPHRMACAKCDFYVPAASSASERLETKRKLQKFLEEVPDLGEDEKAAIEGDIQGQQMLIARLQKVPTPSGQTPEELEHERAGGSSGAHAEPNSADSGGNNMSDAELSNY